MENQIPTPITPEEKNIRVWAAFCHLSALVGFIIPLGHILGPLVIWLIKRDDSDFINEHGKESLNFQITFLIAFFISFLLIFVLIGFPLLFILGIYSAIMVIIATIKTSEGQHYRYPLTWRFLK